ncbi:hypothetical protein DEJ50_00120 [Streptomyces venezuelae]|uniref:Uncharacterized protein n=2 Tax=Streptomyces venezuelae TaxID=54571 RepID=A0A5P2CU84_STRVZ|nr:hypothetical protein DEJ50_00120 [Streptomyces venezuelae]
MANASDTREIPAPADSHADKSATSDGKDLFAGFYFGLGQTGQAIYRNLDFKNDIGELAKNQTPEGREAVAGIVNDVAKDSPAFFADFSTKLRSGDPVRVDQAMTAGAGQLKKYVDEDAAADLGAGQGKCVFNFVAAANVATTVTAVNFVALYNKFWTRSAALDEGLSKDETIAKLTTTLRTA